LLRKPGALDFCQDFFSFGAPLIPFWLFVAQGEILFNGDNQLTHIGETAVADGVLGNVGEEALNKVEPTPCCCAGKISLSGTQHEERGHHASAPVHC